MTQEKLMLITAFSPMIGERVELIYKNKEEAMARNPKLRNFKELWYIKNETRK